MAQGFPARRLEGNPPENPSESRLTPDLTPDRSDDGGQLWVTLDEWPVSGGLTARATFSSHRTVAGRSESHRVQPERDPQAEECLRQDPGRGPPGAEQAGHQAGRGRGDHHHAGRKARRLPDHLARGRCPHRTRAEGVPQRQEPEELRHAHPGPHRARPGGGGKPFSIHGRCSLTRLSCRRVAVHVPFSCVGKDHRSCGRKSVPRAEPDRLALRNRPGTLT
jgi:hypothetical protein